MMKNISRTCGREKLALFLFRVSVANEEKKNAKEKTRQQKQNALLKLLFLLESTE
jgi:hypothetical protein